MCNHCSIMSDPPALTGELSDLAAGYAAKSRAANTRRVYRSAFGHFGAWCEVRGCDPLAGDAVAVAEYLARCAADGLSVSAIQVRLAAIRMALRLREVPFHADHPRLLMVLEGITRDIGVAPRNQKTPAVPDVLRPMLASCGETPMGLRDQAMLLVGFGAGLRRSELVALALGDIHEESRGTMFLIRRSKTDQAGQGERVAVWRGSDPLFCAVSALARWMGLRQDAPDLRTTNASHLRPVFVGVKKNGELTGEGLSDQIVARTIKKAAQAAGLDPKRFAGHSLRAGLATASEDSDLLPLARQMRHKNPRTTQRYVRPAELWRANPTRHLFD